MDAIIIACASRNIVNYLNNESASKDARISRYDLQHLLCDKQKSDDKGNYRWLIKKPWNTFTQDVYNALQNIIVSFKQNLRVINKTTNYYQRYVDGQKKTVPQTKGNRWAIRKPLHTETVYGEVNLRRIKTVALKDALGNPNMVVEKDLKRKLKELLAQDKNEQQIKKYFEANKDAWQDIDLKKIKVYYFSRETKDRFFAVRKPIDTSFNQKKITESVTDTGIQKILLRHLKNNGNDANIAFSPEGIESMNKNLIALNDGKYHQPIYKVRVYEQADKFLVGSIGNKNTKYVEAAKGTNLFFAIYETEQEDKKTGKQIKKRTFSSIPLKVVIDRQKQGLPVAPEDSNGNPPKFVLSPNDLVYVPTKEETENGHTTCPLDKNRIYKMVSCTGKQCFFIPSYVAKVIWDKNEFLSLNKIEKSTTGEMIKEICIPIKVDRLGNLTTQL